MSKNFQLWRAPGCCAEDVFKLESSIRIDSGFVTHDGLVLNLRFLDFSRRLMFSIAFLGRVEASKFDPVAVDWLGEFVRRSIGCVGHLMSSMMCA